MSNYVITISRQFGCGAHEIATKLSEKLGIPYYDKEIIKKSAQKSGFDENVFAFYDEKPTRSFLYNLSTDGIVNMTGSSGNFEDIVFQFQFDTIKKFAEEGNCIVVGRCSDYILKGRENLLTVFLHANDEFRKDRVTKQYGYSEREAGKEIKAMDKKRARFHNYYSDDKWGDARNYDLAIDVSKLGIDETVDLIVNYVQTKFL